MAIPQANGNMFPPGLAVRAVSPADNEPVRTLFIDGQRDLMTPDVPSDVRIAVKKYTDSCLMDDLSRPSVYYSKPGRRMWVLESQQHEIVAMSAVNSDSSEPGIALFQRLIVSPEFRRKGVGRLLLRRAEQWASKQGLATMKLYVTELQPGARKLYELMSYAVQQQSSYGPITVFEMQKMLAAESVPA